MKVERRDGKVERDILVGMIVHTVVLAAVAPKWEKNGLFKSIWANIVGAWCVSFHTKYGKAPGKQIAGMYEAWSRKADEDTADVVEKFLSSISGEYVARKKEINPQYLVDRAGEYFTRVKIAKLRDCLDGDLSQDDLEDALKQIHKFDKIDIGQGATIDVLQNQEVLKDALTDIDAETLIKYPGALGSFYKDALCKDGFIALLGPEKRGKTMMMIDIAWRAMIQRKRVMFYEIGDMSQKQILRRFGVRAAQIPLRPDKVKIPRKMEVDGKTVIVTHKTINYKSGLSYTDARDAMKQVAMEQVRSKNPYLKLEVYPNNTIGMEGIKASVQRQERIGWVPEVVVIDYADLLAPPPGYTESRDQINASWKAMRALSQEYHCLVVTATQANAASYKADTLDMSNFSEDKRKFAHVTGMVGLNQNDEDKEQNVLKLNWLVLRESGYSIKRFCYVAGSPELCSPCMLSAF